MTFCLSALPQEGLQIGDGKKEASLRSQVLSKILL